MPGRPRSAENRVDILPKTRKKNQIKSVEHVCEIYEKIRKHDCDNIFVSASYTYFFSPPYFSPFFISPLSKQNKKRIIIKKKAMLMFLLNKARTFQRIIRKKKK